MFNPDSKFLLLSILNVCSVLVFRQHGQIFGWNGKEQEELLLGGSPHSDYDNKIDNLGQEADAEILIPEKKFEIENLSLWLYRNQ